MNIILTRNNETFLRKILTIEIPEIKEGIIEIHDIIRIPGYLSKVIVESKKNFIDAIGTCIGQGAERIRNIGKYIFPERIEISL